MLPEIDENYADSFPGDELADYIGTKNRVVRPTIRLLPKIPPTSPAENERF